jgi:DNA topoisomerase IA
VAGRVKPKTAAQFKIIKRLLSEATTVVIATDADREGEMIARELLELCQYRGPFSASGCPHSTRRRFAKH